MAILESNEDLKLHVNIAGSFQFEDFYPYIAKSVNKFTRRYLGNLHHQLAEPAEGVYAVTLNDARYFLQEVIANFGMFLYLPLGAVMFDGSGLSNATSDGRAPLSNGQMNDIKKGFLTAGHEAMDQLLALMESKKELFPDWAESDLYTQSKELLVDNAKVFDRYYTIFESRQAYLALQPSIRQVEDQYLKTVFCAELIRHLKTGTLTDIQQDLKDELQKAMVAFTVAKVSNEGLFLIEATGLRIKYDTLSHEIVQNIDYGKSADFVTQTAKQQEDNGIQYLKKAKEIVLNSPGEFNQCTNPLITAAAGDRWTPYNTKSTVAL